MTRNQLIIRNILAHECCHLGATELWDLARKQGHAMSLATVYNSLKKLTTEGQIQEIQSSDGSAVYDARLDPHAHLLCEACGQLVDVDVAKSMKALMREATSRSAFEGLRAEITIRGTCASCQPK